MRCSGAETLGVSVFELMFGKSTFLHPSPVRHCSAVSLLLTYFSFVLIELDSGCSWRFVPFSQLLA